MAGWGWEGCWVEDFDAVGRFAGGGGGLEACSCVGGDVSVRFGCKNCSRVSPTVGFWLGIVVLSSGFVGLVVVAPFSGDFVGGCYGLVDMMIHWL